MMERHTRNDFVAKVTLLHNTKKLYRNSLLREIGLLRGQQITHCIKVLKINFIPLITYSGLLHSSVLFKS